MKSVMLLIMAAMVFFTESVYAEDFYLYNIGSGDTIGKIAKNECDSYMKYVHIAELNNLQSPYVIYAGKQLKMPNLCREDELVEIKDRSMEIDGITIEHMNPAPIGMISWMQSKGKDLYKEEYLEGNQFFSKYEEAFKKIGIDSASVRFLKESVLANEGTFQYVEKKAGLQQCVIVTDNPSELKLFQSNRIKSRFNGIMAKVFTLPNDDQVWIAHNFDLIFFKPSEKLLESEAMADEMLLANAKSMSDIRISDMQIIKKQVGISGKVSWIQETPVRDVFAEIYEDMDSFLNTYAQVINDLGLKWKEKCQLVDLITGNDGVFRKIEVGTALVTDIVSQKVVSSDFVGSLAKVFTLPSGREIWVAHDNERVFLKKQNTMKEEMKIMALAMVEKFFT